MSSTIDYSFHACNCPHCGLQQEVMVVREQDNRTCEVSYCLAHEYKCECGRVLTMQDIEHFNF